METIGNNEKLKLNAKTESNEQNYSYMHWDDSCKERLNIQKHHWEITFDRHNRYYIDLCVQTLSSGQSKMENFVQQCIVRFIIKVNFFFFNSTTL